MKFTRLAAALTLTILAGCATMPSKPATTYYVMRHLDTPEGERDPELTAQGRQRAERLVSWFGGKPLAAIYVTDFRRTRQTAEPLAASRKLTPRIYNPMDSAEVVAMARKEAGPVLIVGHSNTVPDIVEQLGGERPGPLSHPDFGDIWTIGQDGKTARKKIDN